MSVEWAVCGSSGAVGGFSAGREALFSPTALSRSGREGASLEGLAGGKSAASDTGSSSGAVRCLGTGEEEEEEGEPWSLGSLSVSSSGGSCSRGRLGLAGSGGRQLLLRTGRSPGPTKAARGAEGERRVKVLGTFSADASQTRLGWCPRSIARSSVLGKLPARGGGRAEPPPGLQPCPNRVRERRRLSHSNRLPACQAGPTASPESRRELRLAFPRREASGAGGPRSCCCCSAPRRSRGGQGPGAEAAPSGPPGAATPSPARGPAGLPTAGCPSPAGPSPRRRGRPFPGLARPTWGRRRGLRGGAPHPRGPSPRPWPPLPTPSPGPKGNAAAPPGQPDAAAGSRARRSP